MEIYGFVPYGFEGELVSVEADLRTTIPGFDLVGLADGAVKEARERVRAALRNSGYAFPRERVLVNLSPAGVKKEGAAFDLPIALALLLVSEQMGFPAKADKLLVLGELNLSGAVQKVSGVLPAVMKAASEGIRYAVVPKENRREAEAAECCTIFGVDTLRRAVHTVQILEEANGGISKERKASPVSRFSGDGDFADIIGHRVLKRAMEVAAAGKHNIFLFGPPGSGKTMAARRFPSILPELEKGDSLEVTRIYSIAGKLKTPTGLITCPPFRSPHHSASQEGMIGGGKGLNPGEISLAHKGVLFLDETPEFKKSLLQSLREPLEEGKVSIARVSDNYWFPADFQLIMAANPCPCGNMGRDEKICMCSMQEIEGYWKKIGGPLMDRIDIRVPTEPVQGDLLFAPGEEKSIEIAKRVHKVRKVQSDRYRKERFRTNNRIPPGKIREYCPLTDEGRKGFSSAVEKLGLSSRAYHSIIKTARTIADLDGAEIISKTHIYEAVQHRRYGDGDYFWSQRF